MENPEEILHSLEEFAKLKPKDIPRELEEYLCFVAKTGDPVYQWSAVKSLFKEKLINVITEFYESCPSVEIPPCPNVEMFNYDSMKTFILEKLDTFAAAPFTVQRICELLTTPRKEYNRIDKYMRALEKNILVVSTTEPGNRRNAENGEGIVNGIENEHLPEIIAIATATNDMMKEIDYNASWPRMNQEEQSFINVDRTSNETSIEPTESTSSTSEISPTPECRINVDASTSNSESVITCSISENPSTSSSVSSIAVTESENETVSEKLTVEESNHDEETQSVPAQVQKRRNSIEPITTDDNAVSEPVRSMVENTEIQPDLVSSETESLSDSSCSNDTVQTDVSEENSQISEAINIEAPQENEVKANVEEEENPPTSLQISTKPPEEDEVKIDIVEIPKPVIVQEKVKVDATNVEATSSLMTPEIDEPIEKTMTENQPSIEENLSTESPEVRQPIELETKALQDEQTPMEVDVENPDATDQLITQDTTAV